MANFDLEIVSGLVLTSWTDAATAIAPTRINPISGLLHKYWLLSDLITPVRIGCRVGGVITPLDAALGGNLFEWRWIDLPKGSMPFIPATAGQSSMTTFAAGTFSDGHYTIQAIRPSGGAIGISFDVVIP